MSGDVLGRVVGRAADDPRAIAVVTGERIATYSDLTGLVAAYSAALTAQGVGPGDRVAVAGERSGRAIAALLAVWNVGGAFIVLDEDMSRERLARTLAVVEPAAALAAGVLADRLHLAGQLVINLAITAAEPLATGRRPDPSSVAYVVMTSGSTGVPKAVEIEHRHLETYLGAILDRLEVSGPTRFASVSPLWTDLGHTAVFGALACGGTICLPAPATGTSPAALAAEFAARPVEVLKITPSHLGALLAGDDASVLPTHTLVLGGERLPWSLVRRVRALAPDLRIVNHYGPAECTIGVAAGEVDAAPVAAESTVPVGPPLAGTVLRIVHPGTGVDTMPADDVAAGEVGEIVVAGPTVARGYLGDPALTAARFGQLDLDGRPVRCYRTGDLGRAVADGLVEIIGRVDRQVKVRGFRVEPGEVEQALGSEPAVRQAYAFTVDDGGGNAHLVAAVAVDEAIDEATLLAAVRPRLPVAALPARLLILPELPRAASDKVDEVALRALLDQASPAGKREAPADGTEQLIASIWAELLGRPVGRRDNLLHNGANSIAMIRFLARLNGHTGVEIPLATVFEEPTVAALARQVDDDRTAVRAEEG
jgi:amino acid adenylation domain-containing protein